MFWPFTVNMVIDERMIDDLGRWYSMVRMKTKKHGKGIKVFMLGNRYGYMYAITLHGHAEKLNSALRYVCERMNVKSYVRNY